MIKSVTVINPRGESMTMTLSKPQESGFIITSITGLGPAQADINVTDLASDDGSIFNSSRVQNRNIVLNLRFLDMTLTIPYTDPNTGEVKSRKALIEDIRLLSYRYFPIKKKVTLLIQTDNRFVSTEGYIESNEPDIFSSEEGCTISIICPDPYFYVFKPTIVSDSGDGSSVLLTYSSIKYGVISFYAEVDPAAYKRIMAGEDGKQVTSFYSLVNLLEFVPDAQIENKLYTSIVRSEAPYDDLFEFETINEEYNATITYFGDKEIGAVFYLRISGATTGIRLYSQTTGEIINIDTDMVATISGAALKEGDEIIISSEAGRKSAQLLREGTYYNILGALGRNTDWIHLIPGDNILVYNATSGIENILVVVENKIAYEGI